MNISKSKIFLMLILSFIFGVFLANFFQTNLLYYYFISIFIFFIFSIIVRNKIFLIISLSFITFLGGFYYFDQYLQKIVPQNIPYEENINFTARVCDYPDIREDKIKYTLKIIDSQDKNIIGTHILLSNPKYPQFEYGDNLKISAVLEKPENFDAFDYQMYLARYNVFGIIRYNEFDRQALKVEKISHEKFSIKYFIFNLREQIYKNFQQLFSEPQSGILSAIILGLKRAIPEYFTEKLRIVGLSHIVVISGFHVAVMIKIFQSITKKQSKKLVFFLGTLFLIFFIVLTGASPSVIRASIMAWLFLLAPILGRKGNISNILALTVFVMILENPLILVHDVSFQLSVLAVLGLIYLMPIFDKIFKRFGEIVGSTISATLSAQVMTLPVIITSFGRVSIVAPLTNILITPLLPIIIPYGIFIALLSFMSLSVAFVASWPLNLLIKYIVFVTDFFTKLNFSSVEISTNKWFIPIYFLVLISIIKITNNYFAKTNKD